MLVATFKNFNNARDVHVDTDIARIVLQLDCLETTKDGEWSNMFHVHALASVLKKDIISIYPSTSKRIRPLFHQVVSPRILDIERQHSIPLQIMWTHTHEKLSDGWSPNHFVPCICKHQGTCTCKSRNTPSPLTSANKEQSFSEPAQTLPFTPSPLTSATKEQSSSEPVQTLPFTLSTLTKGQSSSEPTQTLPFTPSPLTSASKEQSSFKPAQTLPFTPSPLTNGQSSCESAQTLPFTPSSLTSATKEQSSSEPVQTLLFTLSILTKGQSSSEPAQTLPFTPSPLTSATKEQSSSEPVQTLPFTLSPLTKGQSSSEPAQTLPFTPSPLTSATKEQSSSEPVQTLPFTLSPLTKGQSSSEPAQTLPFTPSPLTSATKEQSSSEPVQTPPFTLSPLTKGQSSSEPAQTLPFTPSPLTSATKEQSSSEPVQTPPFTLSPLTKGQSSSEPAQTLPFTPSPLTSATKEQSSSEPVQTPPFTLSPLTKGQSSSEPAQTLPFTPSPLTSATKEQSSFEPVQTPPFTLSPLTKGQSSSEPTQTLPFTPSPLTSATKEQSSSEPIQTPPFTLSPLTKGQSSSEPTQTLPFTLSPLTKGQSSKPAQTLPFTPSPLTSAGQSLCVSQQTTALPGKSATQQPPSSSSYKGHLLAKTSPLANQPVATSTIFNVLIGSKKQKSIKKTTPVTRSSLKKLFQSNQTSSQSSKGNRNLKQPPCSSSCIGHTLAIKPLHLTNQPVATSTIFNVLVDSQKQRSTSIKKSTPVSRSSLKKLFQSNQTSPQNSKQIQSLETDLTDSHSEAHPCNAELLKHMDPASASDSENDNDDYTYYGKDSDSVSSSSNDSMPSDSDKPDCIEDYSHPEYARLLPFPNVSCEWYKRQHDLELHNVTREQHRRRNAAQVDSKGAVLFVDRSQVKGELADNIRSLREQAEKSQDGSKTHLLSLVAVGEFIMQNGPVVKTQEAGKVYNSKKGLVQRKYSIEFYEVFSKHLNLAQIYMFKTAYLTRNSSNLTGVINSLSSMLDSDDIVKSVVEDRLKEMFPTILKYLDSHRDRQVLKALVAEVTSTSFTAKLQGLKSRKGTRNAKISLSSHLLHYSNIRATSQVVRNDMTNAQQHNLTERIISAIKLKKIKTIGEGRGRKLKTVQFPELATVLSYAFGEFDGGTEAHPWLTTGTMYRASDNATTMKQAREVLLSLAPEGFKISLSSCFNYTENYRKGSIQSKQHHVGKDVNASLSLKKPPRTGVQHLVVNLHWSTANVNLLVDSCHNMPHCLVVSKDAKAIIPTDIAPVQHPGHSWKQRL